MLELNFTPKYLIPKNPVIDLRNNFTGFQGPFVDYSAVENGMNTLYLIDTPETRYRLNSMGLEVYYYSPYNTKTTFRFKVEGTDLPNPNNYTFGEDNIYEHYLYYCYLNDITVDNMPTLYGFPMICGDYFKEPLSLKDITFITDLIVDYMWGKNQYNLKEDDFKNITLLHKIRKNVSDLKDIEKDFK